MRHAATIACLLVIGVLCACSQAPPKPTPHQVVVIRIDEAGRIFWNRQVVDEATLERRFKDVADKQPPAQIHLETDRRSNYSRVAQVLAAAQRTGATHIGFTGIETVP